MYTCMCLNFFSYYHQPTACFNNATAMTLLRAQRVVCECDSVSVSVSLAALQDSPDSEWFWKQPWCLYGPLLCRCPTSFFLISYDTRIWRWHFRLAIRYTKYFIFIPFHQFIRVLIFDWVLMQLVFFFFKAFVSSEYSFSKTSCCGGTPPPPGFCVVVCVCFCMRVCACVRARSCVCVRVCAYVWWQYWLISSLIVSRS